MQYLIKIFIGFSYGVSFPLTMIILDYWLKDHGVSNRAIGLFSLLHLPFMFKFLWGMFIEHYDVPLISKYFSRTKSWIFISYSVLIIGILLMSLSSIQNNVIIMLIGASLVALADGCKNVVLYPYQLNNSNRNMFGFVASCIGIGHRIGSIFTKVSILYIAHFFNWSVAYIFSSFFMVVFMIINLILKEPYHNPDKITNKFSIKEAFLKSFYNPIHCFIKKENGLQLLTLTCLYKSADFLFQKMSRPFCMEIGFSKYEIANIVQCYGSITVIIGSFLGSYILKKIGITKTMFWISIFHGISFVLYLILYYHSTSMILTLVITYEAISGGAMTACFIAFFYTIAENATMYSVLWAIHEFFGLIFMSFSGIIVNILGWNMFFICIPLLMIPSLIILKSKPLNKLQN